MRGGRTAVVVSVYLLLLSGILYLVYSVTRDARTDPWESAVEPGGRRRSGHLRVARVLHGAARAVPRAGRDLGGHRRRARAPDPGAAADHPAAPVVDPAGQGRGVDRVPAAPARRDDAPAGGQLPDRRGDDRPGAQRPSGSWRSSALGLAAVTAGISACVRRVQAATVLAYGFTLLLVVGTLLVFAAASLVDTSRGTDEANAPSWILPAQPARRGRRRHRGGPGLEGLDRRPRRSTG